MAETTAVKMARLETKMESMEKTMEDLKDVLLKSDKKLDDMNEHGTQGMRSRVEQLERQVIDLEAKKNLLGWIIPIATAVMTAFVTFLLLEYLK